MTPLKQFVIVVIGVCNVLNICNCEYHVCDECSLRRMERHQRNGIIATVTSTSKQIEISVPSKLNSSNIPGRLNEKTTVSILLNCTTLQGCEYLPLNRFISLSVSCNSTISENDEITVRIDRPPPFKKYCLLTDTFIIVEKKEKIFPICENVSESCCWDFESENFTNLMIRNNGSCVWYNTNMPSLGTTSYCQFQYKRDDIATEERGKVYSSSGSFHFKSAFKYFQNDTLKDLKTGSLLTCHSDNQEQPPDKDHIWCFLPHSDRISLSNPICKLTEDHVPDSHHTDNQTMVRIVVISVVCFILVLATTIIVFHCKRNPDFKPINIKIFGNNTKQLVAFNGAIKKKQAEDEEPVDAFKENNNTLQSKTLTEETTRLVKDDMESNPHPQIETNLQQGQDIDSGFCGMNSPSYIPDTSEFNYSNRFYHAQYPDNDQSLPETDSVLDEENMNYVRDVGMKWNGYCSKDGSLRNATSSEMAKISENQTDDYVMKNAT